MLPLVESECAANLGQSNVKFYTNIPQSSIIEHIVDRQTTYLDTLGRTVLTIKTQNLADDFRDRELIVSYDYSLMAGLRKPILVFTSMMSVLLGAWVLSKVEVKFSTK